MLDNYQEECTTTLTMRFLASKPLCSVSDTYKRLECFKLDEHEQKEALVVSITEDGLAVASVDNKPPVIQKKQMSMRYINSNKTVSET